MSDAPAELTLEVETTTSDAVPGSALTPSPTTELAPAPEVSQEQEPALIMPDTADVAYETSGYVHDHQQEQQQQPGEAKDFESISLEEKKKPRRIIHFSDGVLEEYSTDEEDGEEEKMLQQQTVDPKTLEWMPFIWHYIVASSFAAYRVCDYMGERLAYFFGITSPKYAYALSEYNRLEEEEKEALHKQISEREDHKDEVAREAAAKAYGDST